MQAYSGTGSRHLEMSVRAVGSVVTQNCIAERRLKVVNS